ncbi:membrane protein YqaA with SNARE-associated domain [Sulfitobacter undariae]|uniref:Membrane protein YqaA with SNARE-associated domain n=1 Tax=Sulfitobacter undariae TaxID=1563671 RepID=A0A7W6GZL5_9RHOB|nr:membrane protein YqaA with SNARE-associated domain [Sulfitobacter undariae]
MSLIVIVSWLNVIGGTATVLAGILSLIYLS